MSGKNDRIHVTVDRPLGSTHPKYPELVYPINYGYAEGVLAPDGEEQDVYILGVDAPLETFEGCLIAVIRRKNDVEDKWVVAPEGMTFTLADIREKTMFQERFFDVEIVLM